MRTYRSEYPNQAHQVAVSLSKHLYATKAGILKYQIKPFEAKITAIPDDKDHVVIYAIKDHFSGLYYSEAWLAQDRPFATSCLVEFSQLYQAPWLNAIRSTTLGHLVLGSTFSWLDIAAYAVGVSVGVLIDVSVLGASSFSAGKRLTPHSTGLPTAAR